MSGDDTSGFISDGEISNTEGGNLAYQRPGDQRLVKLEGRVDLEVIMDTGSGKLRVRVNMRGVPVGLMGY